jgi:hypothetical protein
MTSAKSKIIFIASGGHSGSTLLDLILGSSPEVFSTGELMFFKEHNSLEPEAYYKAPERICTCRRPFRDCDFWRRVTRNWQADYKIIRHKSLAEDVKIAFNIFNPLNRFRFRIEPDETHKLLDAIEEAATAEKPEVKYLLDSSKDPRRLYRLSLEADREIIVIHLVRDVRGFAFSHAKNIRFKPRNHFVSLAEWLVINLVTKAMVRNRFRTISVRYEEFCRDPKTQIELLNRQLGVAIPDDFVETINSSVYHNIGGNGLRLRKVEAIREDNLWQEKLPRFTKLILAPFARLF